MEVTTLYSNAKEAERFTGMGMERQRDLRRHGFLPPTDGRAQFDLFTLCVAQFIASAARAGIRPSAAGEVSDFCAQGIAWHVLGYPEAYSGDHLGLIDAGLVDGRDASEDSLQTRFAEVFDAADKQGGSTANIRAAISLGRSDEGRQAEYLRRCVMHDRYGARSRLQLGQYFIWWADQTEYWANSVNEAFDMFPETDPKRTGPVIVLSLKSMARDLMDRARRPFFHVTLPSSADD